jgi:hypothetical protein
LKNRAASPVGAGEVAAALLVRNAPRPRALPEQNSISGINRQICSNLRMRAAILGRGWAPALPPRRRRPYDGMDRLDTCDHQASRSALT